MGRLSNTDKSSRSGNLDPKSEIDDLSLPYDPVLCGTGLNSSRTGIVKFSSSATIVSGLSLHIEKHSQTLSGRYDRIIPTFSENEILLSGRPDFLTLQQVTPSNVVLLTRVIDEFEDEKTDNDVRELQSWKWRQISFPRCWGVAKLDTDSFIYVTETRKKGEIKLAVTHRNMEIDPDEKWCWEDSSSLVIQPSREVLESLVPHSPFTKMLRSLCDEITLGCFDTVSYTHLTLPTMIGV